MSNLFRNITSIIICVLAFFLVICTGLSVVYITEDLNTYHVDEDSLLYSLKYEEYPSLLRSYHRNQAIGVKPTETMEECYAIARYYEAAIDYKLALQESDSELKQKSEEIMNTAVTEMGSLSYAKAEIDELLGI